jgi:hypothetical protein
LGGNFTPEHDDSSHENRQQFTSHTQIISIRQTFVLRSTQVHDTA